MQSFHKFTVPLFCIILYSLCGQHYANYLWQGKRHISILSTRNVIWTLGGGGGGGRGLALVTFFGEKSWKISIVWWTFLVFWNHILTKYTKSSIFISVFTLRIYVCSLSAPGFSPRCTFILLHTKLNLKACQINYRKKCVTFLRGGGGCLQKNVHMTFLLTKSICVASLTL